MPALVRVMFEGKDGCAVRALKEKVLVSDKLGGAERFMYLFIYFLHPACITRPLLTREVS